MGTYVKDFIKRNWKVLIGSLLIIIFLEITLFNCNSYRLLLGDYEYKKISAEDMKFEGITYLENNNIYISHEEEPYIEIENIDTEIATIYFDFGCTNLPIRLLYTDENSENYRVLPIKNIVSDYERSKYITCYFSGASSKIRIELNPELEINDTLEPISEVGMETEYLIPMRAFNVNSIEINKPVPFTFNIFRVLIIYSLFLFIFITLKTCNAPYDEKSKNYMLQRLMIISVLFAFGYLIMFINFSHIAEDDYYNKDYVNAILSGKFSLDIEPSEELKNMENAFDATERYRLQLEKENEKRKQFQNLIKDYNLEKDIEKKINIEEKIKENFTKETEELFENDAVWYNNEYYMYFGILPLLLFYVPFTAITGLYLPHLFVVFITCIVSMIFLYKILIQVYNKYFNKVPFKFLLYALIIVLFGSLLILLSSEQIVYETCQGTGMMLGIIALYNLLKISDEKYFIKKDYKYVLIASICFALTVACRPNYLIYSVLFIPTLYNKVLRNITKIDKKELIKTILIIGIPYIIVACGLMYLNYIRFGSVTEFGFSYQLTVNDNSNINYRYVMLPFCFFEYLFDIPKFINTFPFFKVKQFEGFNAFMYCYHNNQFGGIIFLAPVTLLLLAIRSIKNENKKLKSLLYSLLVTALLIILCLSYTAGINIRYFIDFSWLLVLISTILMFNIYTKLETNKEKKLFSKAISILTLITIISGIVVQGITGEKTIIKNTAPVIYSFIEHSVCFWY